MATDRRAGKKNVPHVGKVPRSRNNDGSWRKKRSDAGKPRKKQHCYRKEDVSMAIGDKYKTGDISPASAYFEWVKYTDGSFLPSPTSDEMKIPMDKGKKFPPVRSCDKGAWWKMTSYK